VIQVDFDSYVTFLVVGVVLVAIDGQIVYRSGRALLEDAYPDQRASRSMMQLVTVLFHLVVLGVLALISTIDINTGHPVQDVVVRLGVVLLVLAAAHGATVAIVAHIRDRRRGELLADELVEQRGDGGAVRPTIGPVGDDHRTRKPKVSPAIDNQGPYPSTG
jgi:hypothetical protein